MNWARSLCGSSLLVLASMLFAPDARALVERKGDWPASSETVNLSLAGTPRSQALRELASAAGWSLVIEQVPDDPVDLEISGQSATDVLDALLGEGEWVATRRGNLVTIAPVLGDDSPAPQAAPSAVTPAPSAAPVDTRAEDRMITGSSLRIEAHERVHDVAVLGGSAEILGTVTGDVAVFGGFVTLRKGGRVQGDVAVFGGGIEIEEGADVDGDTVAFGGSITRDGKVTDQGFALPRSSSNPFSAAAHIAHSLAHGAFLFLAGALLLALAPSRVETLEFSIASRPLRALAAGLIGLLVGGIVIASLAITCVGIPIALFFVFVMGLAMVAGSCAGATTLGGLLVRHKSKSAYVHLAVGCLLVALVSMLPFFGDLAMFVLSLLGLGAVILTRAAGLVPRRPACRAPGSVG